MLLYTTHCSLQKRTAFTLIEILIVIGIIGVLSSITLVAINPTKQLSDARDAERRSIIRETENALYQYLIKEWELPEGEFPLGAENAINICREGITDDPTCLNLDALTPEYFAAIPVDVVEENANYTGYGVYVDDHDRTHVVSFHMGELGGEEEGEGGGGNCPQTAGGGGSGTLGDPYTISTCAHLANIANNVGAHYVLTDHVNCDIAPYNTGEGFTPIGTGGFPFTGSLDGQGCIISGLYRLSESYGDSGMFGYIGAGSSINNLGIENINITSQCAGGGLATTMNGGTVSDVYVTGTMTITLPSSCGGGGLIGFLNGGTVSNAYSLVDVTGGPGTAGVLVGAIFGTVQDSFADGDVSGTAEVGAIGVNGGTITDFYWNNTDGNPSSCYYDGDVGCTAIADNSVYFYDPANEPMASWDFDTVWQDNSPTGYPTLR